jgi:hypothetical protein
LLKSLRRHHLQGQRTVVDIPDVRETA